MRKENDKKMNFKFYLRNSESGDSFVENRLNLQILSQIFGIMKNKKITNAELAKRMGVSRAYITKLFNGNCNFTIKTLINISKALDCKIDISLTNVKVH
ncbi:MAG: helix-turn-helix domain-containing protein [Vulcanibacillus sp.]